MGQGVLTPPEKFGTDPPEKILDLPGSITCRRRSVRPFVKYIAD